MKEERPSHLQRVRQTLTGSVYCSMQKNGANFIYVPFTRINMQTHTQTHIYVVYFASTVDSV